MLIVADNIDIACAAIEKAAMERAVVEVDDAFSLAYADRRLHREASTLQDLHIHLLSLQLIRNLATGRATILGQ